MVVFHLRDQEVNPLKYCSVLVVTFEDTIRTQNIDVVLNCFESESFVITIMNL